MPTFQYVSPTEEQKATMQKFRDKFQGLYEEIEVSRVNGELPDKSRALSLALTNLEQSAMWLNKAITKND
jgi:hypothetical protein